MWWVYALMSAFFASLTAIFAKIGIEGVNSNLATAIRTIVILVLIWAIVYFRGEYRDLCHIDKHCLVFLILSGIATGLSWICYFKAIKMGPVSQVAFIDKLSVVLTLLLACAFLGETISLKTGIAAGLICSGVVLLIV